jgi:hypothetical protein
VVKGSGHKAKQLVLQCINGVETLSTYTMTDLLSLLWTSESVPLECKKGVIIKFLKKGIGMEKNDTTKG